MRDRQDWEGSFGRFAVIVLAFLVVVAIARGGPWTIPHIPPNPGPSGTQGSTGSAVLHDPPPEVGLSQTTTGMAR
jgi:hypothetical protein